MNPEAAVFAWPLRVYIEDTDAGGIVYYANYLKFLERARTEYLRGLGFGKAALPGSDTLFVVHSVDIRYRAPARLDETLVATVRLHKLTPASVVFEQTVQRDRQILCEATVRLACVSGSAFQPVRIPEAVHAALQAESVSQGEPSS